MSSYKTFKFLTNSKINDFLCIYAAAMLAMELLHASWWLAAIIAVAIHILCMLPTIQKYYPVITAFFFVLAIIGAAIQHSFTLYISVALLIFHVFRIISVVMLFRRDPIKALDYCEKLQEERAYPDSVMHSPHLSIKKNDDTDATQKPSVASAVKPESKTVYLMDDIDGNLVRVPESKLASWEEAQSEPHKPLTEAEKLVRDRIVNDIFNSSSKKNSLL